DERIVRYAHGDPPLLLTPMERRRAREGFADCGKGRRRVGGHRQERSYFLSGTSVRPMAFRDFSASASFAAQACICGPADLGVMVLLSVRRASVMVLASARPLMR